MSDGDFVRVSGGCIGEFVRNAAAIAHPKAVSGFLRETRQVFTDWTRKSED